MKAWLVGVVCFIAGLIVVPLVAWIYLDYGRPPVAVADSAFPFEKQIVRAPLHGRIDDPAGETFRRVRNGIRLTGMPAYGKTLSETQMWQVSLLLASAASPRSVSVQRVLATP